MLRRGSTFLFAVASTLATILALYLSLTLTALLLPLDILYYVFFALPVFLLTAAALTHVVDEYLGKQPDLEGTTSFRAWFVVAISLINVLMVTVAVALIYLGVTTLMEAVILGAFAHLGCLAIYKRFFWT